MRISISLSSIIIIAVLATSCGKDTGELDLNFSLTYDNEPLVMFQDYTYPTGEIFSLSRVSFYIADLSLDEEDITSTEYIDLTDSHSTLTDAQNGFTYKSTNVPAGNYSTLRMSLGVSRINNAKNPAEFDPSSALSRSGEYWNAWESYVFYKIEGMIDSNGDGTKDKGISLHIGGNEVFRSLSFPKEINITNETVSPAKITIDLAKVFNNKGTIYDMDNFSNIASKVDHLNYMIELMDNTVETMTIE